MPDLQVPSAFRFLYQGKARYRVSFGGRGSAKSHSFAQALVVKARHDPLRVLCCREIQKSIKDSSKRLLDDKIEASGYGKFFDSTDTEIRGKNGSLFMFAGLRTNPESIKSMEGIDVAWVEEANTVSQRSLDLLIPTIRKPGSELWFNWNPRRATDPVDAMFRGGELPPESIVREVSWQDNPWFPEVLRADMEWDRRRDPEKYAHIWLGEYERNSEARVFRNWRIDRCEPPEGARFYYGADWGFSVDPTVLIRCWIDGRTVFIDQEAYEVGCEIDRTPDLFDKVPGSRLWPIRADSASPQTISYMQRHGFPRMVPAVKGQNSVEEGVNFLKSYDIVVHPDCKHLIDELTLYSFKVDKLTDEVLPALEDKHNHCIDALRYAVEQVRTMGSPLKISDDILRRSALMGRRL